MERSAIQLPIRHCFVASLLAMTGAGESLVAARLPITLRKKRSVFSASHGFPPDRGISDRGSVPTSGNGAGPHPVGEYAHTLEG
jgi:hypothetical protein